jgi:hypothetical protein
MYGIVDVGIWVDGDIVDAGNVVDRVFVDTAVCVCVVQCVIWVLLCAWMVSWNGCGKCNIGWREVLDLDVTWIGVYGVMIGTSVVGGCDGNVCMDRCVMYNDNVNVYDTSVVWEVMSV